MKKLKLKALELGAEELLQREQLKNIIGGSGGSGDGSCSVSVNCYKTIWQNGQWVSVANGSISCSSSTGSCTHSDNSVSCDGTNYNC